MEIRIFAKQTDLSISAGYGKISLDNENNIYFLSQGKLIKYNTNYELQWEKILKDHTHKEVNL